MSSDRPWRSRIVRGARRDHGFTLIELLVVVVIIGILIAIAIPLYSAFTRNGADAAAKTDARNAVDTVEHCIAQGDGTPPMTATQSGSDVIFAGCDTPVHLSPNDSLAYSRLSTTRFSVTVTNARSGRTYSFDSAHGVVGSS